MQTVHYFQQHETNKKVKTQPSRSNHESEMRGEVHVGAEHAELQNDFFH